jgi:hydrogenase maturation protein HypF
VVTITHEIRVRGRVQGVGFRPFVWRWARHFFLSGHVLNDKCGVLILIHGPEVAISAFTKALTDEPPPLALITGIEVRLREEVPPPGFRIIESAGGQGGTQIAPDFATCPACRAETLTPGTRRHGYAFTNCTHCGPRLSIIHALPYDRANTTMRAFPLCEDCAAEYTNPADRRFHAEPIACPACGPQLVLARWASMRSVAHDPVQGAQEALCAGEIIAIKALGGYQLACDATNPNAVARLRAGKKRDGKPFALMARDLEAMLPFVEVSALEAQALGAREAPILLLRAKTPHALAEGIAPGLATLGFMLPSNPVQILLLNGLDRPLVMTSGNLSGDPQITDDTEAREKLGGLAGFALTHTRAITNRIDDSVAREMGGRVRLIRRARGYAPAALPLPPGLENAPDLTAFGADLKATFCLISGGQAVLGAHQGDLESAEAIADFETNLGLYTGLHAHGPALIVTDMYEGYVATRLASAAATAAALPLVHVQHHHAHLAAVMGEHLIPNEEVVIGITLDGLGSGDDGTLWGAELLLATYAKARRIGGLKPTPLPGGDAAAREPWRNLYAALATHIGWPEARLSLAGQAVLAQLAAKPLPLIDTMMSAGLNAPQSSSCGRLFDAVAAALGCGFERQCFEGEAAVQLEALCDGTADGDGYAFGVVETAGFFTLDPAPFWRALLADLAGGRNRTAMARDFHAGLMTGFCEITTRAARLLLQRPKVGLCGGSFQNRLLFEGLTKRLEARGFEVLTPEILPTNDGGIAFGQALVAAARNLP